MILSNTEIQKALEEGLIELRSPESKPEGLKFDTTSVDLRLDSSIREPRESDVIIDISEGNTVRTLNAQYEKADFPQHGYILEPGKFILSQTLEYVKLPMNIAARVEGKSSRARYGLLVHFTAPTIHAGFEGNIALEIINLGKYKLRLIPGMYICQLIFELVQGDPTPNPSAFHGQTSPSGI